MSALADLKSRLRPGQVYRRKDLEEWTTAVDRHLRQLLEDGSLEKVAAGVYQRPRRTRFGPVPAQPDALIAAFLGERQFLVISPSDWNSLGVGTTQLSNQVIVYNRKRHGRFELDGRIYDFRRHPSVPKKLSKEILLVDLLHNLHRLPDEAEEVLSRALALAKSWEPAKLRRAVDEFGSARARRLLAPVLLPKQTR